MRLDAYKRYEDSPQPIAHEDYSHMISRSKLEFIVANTWKITIILQWYPILKETSIIMVIDMGMKEIGDEIDEQWWWVSFVVV
jgi:hypothetical protein